MCGVSDVSMYQGMNQRMVAGAAMQMGIRILQASTMELGQIVRQALESNPVLEQERPDELISRQELWEDDRDTARDGDDWDSRLAPGSDASYEESAYDSEAAIRHDFAYDSIASSESLTEFLKRQIQREALPEDVERAAQTLVDNLDERGFFVESPEDVAEENGFSSKLFHEAWNVVRGLEPDGVGARDLKDSLMIQLEHAAEGWTLAFRLIRDCWDELTRHRYAEAADKLGVEPEDVEEAVVRIARLNPNPGSGFMREANPYLSPDVVVEEERDGSLSVSMTGSYVPRLRLDDAYKETLSEHGGNVEVRDYLKKCFREGRELIRAISQRQETILQIAQVLVRRQEAFFKKGDRFLLPLGMESVAKELGIHASTVSRAVGGKYLLCKWGYRELRSFFSSGVRVAGERKDGASDEDSLASSAVQALIREILKEESPAKPYSDAALVRKLEEKGIRIARRTVAKYREQMKILPASLRRKG